MLSLCSRMCKYATFVLFCCHVLSVHCYHNVVQNVNGNKAEWIILEDIPHNYAGYPTQFYRTSHAILQDITSNSAGYSTQFCRISHTILQDITRNSAGYSTQFCRIFHTILQDIPHKSAGYPTQFSTLCFSEAFTELNVYLMAGYLCSGRQREIYGMMTSLDKLHCGMAYTAGTCVVSY
jgi:hypothetical protein